MINLSNLHLASKQQVFNQMLAVLSKQKKKCINSSIFDQPLYHFKDLRSPAGSLIDESEYSSSMEGFTWKELVKENRVPSAHCELIDNVNNVHDMCTVEEWPITLKEIATQEQLDYQGPLFCKALGIDNPTIIFQSVDILE